MRIVQIAPGTGDSFYCENCLRDSVLARQMIKLGHDVMMVPMYLPVGIERQERVDEVPIFFGGINVYLQQKWGLFRHTPGWIDRMLDSKRLLNWAGRRVGMTSARQLGRTTVSMLRGEQGRQKKELHRLLQWLSEQPDRPDVVCLSNVLLAGLVRGIKAELGVGVVSLLQDEDTFLDGLAAPYSENAWEMVGELCSEIDGFVAVSRYFGKVMQKRLSISEDRMHVVPPGVRLERYEPAGSAPRVPTVGYLSRMCPERGLDTLVEAFVMLKAKEGLKDARLRIAGGASVSDKRFVKQLREGLRGQGLLEDVEFLPDFDWPERGDFLRSLSVLCVPEKFPVAGGVYVLEAWATGVPVVEPDMGVFSELVGGTGGGVLYEAGNSQALSESLGVLLGDPQRAAAMGQRGRDAVCKQYNVERSAEEMVQVFDMVAERYR